ncbi:hypothetical protein J3F84DRAFT_355927 [Trichoderma pleuroticola]
MKRTEYYPAYLVTQLHSLSSPRPPFKTPCSTQTCFSHITYGHPYNMHTCIHKLDKVDSSQCTGFQIPIPRSSASLASPIASESRPRGNPIQPWRPIHLAHIMLCSHKKRTIFSHCEQLVRSLLYSTA